MSLKFKNETIPRGGILLKEKEYSEPHLRLVLVKLENEYVTWVHNMESGGFHHGKYTSSLIDAEKHFKNRC